MDILTILMVLTVIGAIMTIIGSVKDYLLPMFGGVALLAIAVFTLLFLVLQA